jgi:hypothetical protein
MIRMRDSPVGLLSQANAIRVPSGEYVGEDAVHGRAFPIGVDVRELRVTFSMRDESLCERTSTIDCPSGANVRLRISPFSNCPCHPFHCQAIEPATNTATVLAAINNSLRRLWVATELAAVTAGNSPVPVARFSR